jgi:hypothetical protein
MARHPLILFLLTIAIGISLSSPEIKPIYPQTVNYFNSQIQTPLQITQESDCKAHNLKLRLPIKNHHTIFFWAKIAHVRGQKSYTIARIKKGQVIISSLKLIADQTSNIKWDLHFTPEDSSDYFFHKVTQTAAKPYPEKWFYIQLKLNKEKSTML